MKLVLIYLLPFAIGFLVGYFSGALIGIFHYYRKTKNSHHDRDLLAALDFIPGESDEFR